ncbi:hypothetical protein L9F63_021163, partial [Diploptera punctata]
PNSSYRKSFEKECIEWERKFIIYSIYCDPECTTQMLDHGVLVVGYGHVACTDYWLVKNSWSEDWGDNGYIKMCRNKNNNCGIATQASYPLFCCIYCDPDCSSKNLDHAVLVVGYGTDKETKQDYYIVKNSWAADWGENGYLKMCRNQNNNCGIATQASYPLV